MARHLGAGLALLVTGLAPSRIMVIGEVTRAWRRVGSILQRVLAERSRTHTPPAIEPTEDAAQLRLCGTIALVIQKHFAAPSLVGVTAKGAGI
jgi:predicted NBD/HSP70 family sugar kinase